MMGEWWVDDGRMMGEWWVDDGWMEKMNNSNKWWVISLIGSHNV